MKKKLFVLGLVMALVVSLAGCASSSPSAGDVDSVSPSSSEVPPETSAPEEPESEPSSSEPEAETPKEKPTSIYLLQNMLTFNGPTPVWELTIENEEEIALVEGLLSTEDLTPSAEEYAMWPDGGNPVHFEIYYENHTVIGGCNPQYHGGMSGRGYTSIILDEEGIFYDYPYEAGDELLAFLESKGITVGG